MRQSPRRPWLPLVLLVLGLFLLVLHESGLSAPVENLFHYPLDPLQRIAAFSVRIFGGLFQSVGQVRDLRAENDDLRTQVDALTVENVRLREHAAEAQQLREMLNFASEFPVSASLGAEVVGHEACDTFPCGEVVGTEPNPYLRYLTINVGEIQGAGIGMSVVSAGGGLVGRISKVGPRMSQVQLLTDSDSAVAALLQTTRTTGLVQGQPDGTLRMRYIPQGETTSVGDIVLTSGLGGTVPKGLVIGQLIDVEQHDYELFQAGIIRPAVDFARLEMVMVITTFEWQPLEQPLPEEEG